MRGRQKSWLAALAGLRPTWEPPHRLCSGRVHGCAIKRALLWPFSAYKHFGVRSIWSLGEYTQWADLGAALATLGVNVVFWPYGSVRAPSYPKKVDFDEADVVFIDYEGIHGAGSNFSLPPRDKTWILDTFGTDGTIVDHPFFGRQSPLTNYPLHRFLTLVPGFSPRNTFLGTATVGTTSEAAPNIQLKTASPMRKWRCVLWSKVHPWLKDRAYHGELLREYTRHCPVVATIDSRDKYQSAKLIKECCPDVEILDVQTPSDFTELLRSSAVYVGVGEPLIAPSCFEALSLGTHVIQPRFPEPRVLANKPSSQEWSSQHPFLERVPEPYVFTIDAFNRSAIAAAFATIRAGFDATLLHGSGGGRQTLASPALEAFYAYGEHPNREVYSISGFLARIGRILRTTVPLEASDWAWELEVHPEQVPLDVGGLATQLPRTATWL